MPNTKTSDEPAAIALAGPELFAAVQSGADVKVTATQIMAAVLLLLGDTDGTLAANSDSKLATQKAIRTYVAAQVAALVASSPAALDTLNELATALGNDPSFATTMATALGLKAPIASPTFTGTPAAPTAAPGTNTAQLATTAFVAAATVASGTELKGLTFTSDTGSTSDADSSAGFFWWNNATQASSTVLFFDNLTADAVSTTTFFAALATTGFIYVQQSDDSTKWQMWKWSAVTAGSGYYKFTVTLMASGGSIADNKTVYVNFVGAGGVSLSTVNVFTKNQSVTPFALTDGATVSVDASESNNFLWTIGGNRTLSNPTNLTSGMVINLSITQDGTGSRLVTWGSKYKNGDGTAFNPTLQTTAGSVDFVSMSYHAASDTLRCAYLGSATSASLTNFTEAVNSSSPNATIPVVSLKATNAATDVDAVFGAKGTGDILAQVPDSTTTGGNKRGGRSVDWQSVRSAAAMVASGFGSVISGGTNNRASANYSTVIGGTLNVASAEGAIAGGGIGGTSGSTASTASAIALGSSATASGSQAIAFGAATASGAYSFAIGMGSAHAAASSSSFNILASGATLSGVGSFALGGQNGNARSIGYVQVQGVNGGRSQWMRAVLSVTTSDATPTTLTTDNGAASTTNQLNIANGVTMYVKGQVLAYDVSYSGGPIGGNRKAWDFSVVVQRRDSASIGAILGTPVVTVVDAASGAAAWDVTFSYDGTNKILRVFGTGAASKSICWVCHVDAVESQDFNT